jgi:sugar (pentulose or hexulose) kinase
MTDVGMASTYMQPLDRVIAGADTLIAGAAEAGADIVVMEIADGILQLETAALLADPAFRARLDGIIFACGDALAAAYGVERLRALGLDPIVVTGPLSASPMASAEAQAACGARVVTKSALQDPAGASAIANAALSSGAARRAA